jgi:hypothetical protein
VGVSNQRRSTAALISIVMKEAKKMKRYILCFT